jgi:hypothetical protein
MNKKLLEEAGYGDHVNLIAEGKCPLCEAKVNLTDFTDPLSKREFEISGICQKCQDDIFTE